MGRFKETKRIAYFEAWLNVVISVAFVIKWGIIGVTVGTLVAAVFRASMFALYLGKNIIPRSYKYYISHVIVSISVMFVVLFIGNFVISDVSSISLWILKAIVMTIISTVLTLLSDIIIWRSDCSVFVRKVFSALKIKKL